jgi:hypothetical protein
MWSVDFFRGWRDKTNAKNRRQKMHDGVLFKGKLLKLQAATPKAASPLQCCEFICH